MGSKGQEQKILEALLGAPDRTMTSSALSTATKLAQDVMLTHVNNMLKAKQISLVETAAGAETAFQGHTKEETVLYSHLSPDELLVYQIIKASHNQGIWTKDMKLRTNLPQPKIQKILRSLEGKSLVKSIKSVQHANRKVYMVIDVEPAKEVSGGAWYTNNNFDQEFVEVLRKAAFTYIQKKSDCTLPKICDFVRDRGLTKVPLSEEDVRSVVMTLIYEGQVEVFDDTEDDVEHFRPCVMGVSDDSAFTSMPCGQCLVFTQCAEGGPVAPSSCEYLKKWLDF